jgi:hypothetical protein
MVPIGNTAEGQLPYQWNGPAQAQAEQGIQAQTEAVLPIRQDLHGFRLAGLSQTIV